MGDYFVSPKTPKAREQKESIYRKNYPQLLKEHQKIAEESERLISRYESILSDSDICKARKLYWGCNSLEEYLRKFFRVVLVEAYNVWDESHVKYEKLLEIIECKDPFWKEQFVTEHERKVKVSKRPIYDCEVVPLK